MRTRKMACRPRILPFLWTTFGIPQQTHIAAHAKFSMDEMLLFVINPKNGYNFTKNNFVHRGILKSTTRYGMSYLYRVFILYGYEKRF